MSTTIYFADAMLKHYFEMMRDAVIGGSERAESAIICPPPHTDSEEELDKYCGLIEDLLKKFSINAPDSLLYICGMEVYGRNEGDNFDESTHTWAVSQRGKAMARIENMLIDWAEGNKVPLAILRPVEMYGRYMGEGRAMSMYRSLLRGTYFLVRDAVAEKSIVTAFDVVRSAMFLIGKRGIYNISDGLHHPLREIAEAMLDNHGSGKRPMTLTAKQAKIVGKVCSIIPEKVREAFSGLAPWPIPEELAYRTSNLTFSNENIEGLLPFKLYNVCEVLKGIAKGYPYEERE